MKSSIDMCVPVATPLDPKWIWSGRVRARAISSFTDLAGSDG